MHENVQFTVYRPREVQPERWYPLIAFAHLSERSPDAPRDAPDPLAEVDRQARGILGDQVGAFAQVRQDSTRAVSDEAEVTFVPEIPGFRVEPEARTFRWIDIVHREEFQMRAGADLDGQVARGRLSVFLGRILLAEVPLAIRVDSAASPAAVEPTAMAPVLPFRRIFASYSHRDEAIVTEHERIAGALGDRYLRDVRELRAGEVWSRRLEELIAEADVFQLFWSWNALRSQFVEQEWRFALALGRPNFIRPTYWEEPLPEDPANDLPPADLRRVQFHLLRGGAGNHPSAPLPAEAVKPVANAVSPQRRRSGVGLKLGTALVLVIGIGWLVRLHQAAPPVALDEPMSDELPMSVPPSEPVPSRSSQDSRPIPAAKKSIPANPRPTQYQIPAPSPLPVPARPLPTVPRFPAPEVYPSLPPVPARPLPTAPPSAALEPVEAISPERLQQMKQALSTAARLAQRARDAYEVTNPGGAIGRRMDRFVEAAEGLLWTLRERDYLTMAWKRDARSLLELESEIDRLAVSKPFGSTTSALWQEVRRQLEILENDL